MIVFLGGLKFWIFFERKLNEEVITVENLVGLFAKAWLSSPKIDTLFLIYVLFYSNFLLVLFVLFSFSLLRIFSVGILKFSGAPTSSECRICSLSSVPAVN